MSNEEQRIRELEAEVERLKESAAFWREQFMQVTEAST